MAQGLFQKVSGKSGRIDIERLGVLVGTMKSWSLTRRADDKPGSGLYDLLAVFSYLNPHLWEDPGYEKRVVIDLGKDSFIIVQEPPFAGHRLSGRQTIQIEGVRLEQP